MDHQTDEQWEELNFMLGQEAFKQDRGDSQQSFEQRGGTTLSDGFQQKLQNSESSHVSSVIEIRPDLQREQRKGVPEVIFGETKEIGQIIAMARNILEETGRAIISRVQPEAVEALRESFQAYTFRFREAAHAVVITRPDYVRRSTGGLVGVISAGTSDIPVAEEAALLAEEMGCDVTCIYDVGVAGLHRLVEPLRSLLAREVDAIIVAAGMDGALPSVVAGLVPVPVIGLPTSVGYGLGGKGVAALLSMLQTCAPGLSVVNIDNGIGAGITAAMIANRVARARNHQSP
ncbi:MAG TPA: nickel pincer cofactor biosynthesis protein LarB [Ktedonobacteraceae bacterium]|nr:nickel pincer cofactor biosynthesis protein LarB [Ktedonobacteraceae bacterium]